MGIGVRCHSHHVGMGRRMQVNAEAFHEYQREDWMRYAACRGYPTKWWFTDHHAKYMNAARRVCAACPVQQPCLDAALLRNEEGIWGGLTPLQRGRIRSQHAGTYQQLRCTHCRMVFQANAKVADRVMYCSNQCRKNASYHRTKG